jgi:hypothetical protein
MECRTIVSWLCYNERVCTLLSREVHARFLVFLLRITFLPEESGIFGVYLYNSEASSVLEFGGTPYGDII